MFIYNDHRDSDMMVRIYDLIGRRYTAQPHIEVPERQEIITQIEGKHNIVLVNLQPLCRVRDKTKRINGRSGCSCSGQDITRGDRAASLQGYHACCGLNA